MAPSSKPTPYNTNQVPESKVSASLKMSSSQIHGDTSYVPSVVNTVPSSKPVPQMSHTQSYQPSNNANSQPFYDKDTDNRGDTSDGEDLPPDDLDEGGRAKRSELVESPTTKQTYKQFFKQFKAKEKDGLLPAQEFAEQNLKQLPVKVHWKVYLELADLAKRENSLKLARRFYRRVIQLQPYASQGWLEYAKMEEECGQLDRCAEILSAGLSYCPYNESLMVKDILNPV